MMKIKVGLNNKETEFLVDRKFYTALQVGEKYIIVSTKEKFVIFFLKKKKKIEIFRNGECAEGVPSDLEIGFFKGLLLQDRILKLKELPIFIFKGEEVFLYAFL